MENAATRPRARLRMGLPRLAGMTALLFLAIGGASPAAQAAADAERVLAVLPFEIEETSGEVGPNQHQAMLARVTTLVGEQIAAANLYDVVPEERVKEAVAVVNSGTFLRRCNGGEIDIAKRVGARYVLIGWIYKVSTLVLTFHVAIRAVRTGKPIYARVFDFRGDNERAYAHAAKTLVRSLVVEKVGPPTN